MSIFQSSLSCPDPPRIPLADFVIQEIQKHGDRIAFVDPVSKDEFTFRYVSDTVKKLSVSLQGHGVERGDRVAFCSANSVEAAIALLAVSRCGATVTLANPMYTQRELEHFVEIAEPTHWFCIPSVLPRIPNHDSIKKIFIFGSDGTSDHVSYQQLLEVACEKEFESPAIDFDNDIATLPFSSGTTGLPKGVMLTHRNVVTALVLAKAWLDDLSENDVTVCFLPFFHQYGLMIILYCLFRGVKTIIMPRFTLPDLLQNIQTYKVTSIPLVPPIAVLLAKHPIIDNYDLSSVKQILNSAAALTKEVAELVTKRLGASVKQGYGMTETTFGTHYTTGDVQVGAVGRLLPLIQAKVVDLDSGAVLEPNQDGEICVRGPLIMKGYRLNKAATEDCLDADGWLKTGDIGCCDETGCFWYKDRKKELIKYNAYQVAPAELEGLLVSHPLISDAAVIGIPDEATGELPRAYAVKQKDAQITEKEIFDYIASNVAPFKKLRGGVVFVDSIPRSASGKILRRELKAQALAEITAP